MQINVSGTDPSQYLNPFDLYSPSGDCLSQVKENRFNLNFTNSNDGSKETLYCWKSIAAQQPKCVVGSICSQYSYTEARTAFCLAFGGEIGGCGSNELANQYVPGINPNEPVLNERGGIIAYNPAGSCSNQAVIGQLQCFVNSARQSAANVLNPSNYKNLIYTAITLSVFIGILVLLIHYKLIKLKKKYKPHFRG